MRAAKISEQCLRCRERTRFRVVELARHALLGAVVGVLLVGALTACGHERKSPVDAGSAESAESGTVSGSENNATTVSATSGSASGGASASSAASGAMDSSVAAGGLSAGGADAAGGEGGEPAEGDDSDGTAATTNGAGGATTGAGGSATVPVDCQFDVAPATSSAIPTVGIVQWSTTLPEVNQARIEFGLDANYGMTAPVDLDEPNFRTLLLGLEQRSEYHLRIIARMGNSECVSEDFALDTGALEETLVATVSTPRPEEVADGFITISANGTRKGVFILNSKGALVWHNASTLQMPRAILSYDGKHMLALGGTSIYRVSLDGSDADVLRLDGMHHDFTVMPDNSIAFIRTLEGNPCGEIARWQPDGSVSMLFDARDAFPPETWEGSEADPCHLNSLHYNAGDASFTLSALNSNAYAKFSAAGAVEWVLGGVGSDFSGEAIDWRFQHGHQLLGPDRFLLYTNSGSNGWPEAREILLDHQALTATTLFSYESIGGHSPIYGDVQRLPNGNTLITHSQAGTMLEVNPDAELVREIVFDTPVGYANYRETLYGHE